MKNSSDTIENRTRDLPTCSAMPQPTALPRAPNKYMYSLKYRERFQIYLAGYENACHFSLEINFLGNNLAVIELCSLPTFYGL